MKTKKRRLREGVEEGIFLGLPMRGGNWRGLESQWRRLRWQRVWFGDDGAKDVVDITKKKTGRPEHISFL